jgi:squalene cyclase
MKGEIMGVKDKFNLDESVGKGLAYNMGHHKDDGSVHLDGELQYQVWETINALLAVQAADPDNTGFIDKAIEFLLKEQREEGSFYHEISHAPGHYCMETTPMGLMALAKANVDIGKGTQFVLDKQMEDGSWEIGTPEITRRRFWPSITGFVLRFLLQQGIDTPHIAKGIDYLLKTQQEDGSWGDNWIYYDTPYYPTYNIMPAFMLYGIESEAAYDKAASFIKANQKDDGSWDENIIDKPRPSDRLRTTMALHSLLAAPRDSDIPAIEKGMEWLLNAQEPDGHWYGGGWRHFPGKKENIYLTSVVVRTIKRYQELF